MERMEGKEGERMRTGGVVAAACLGLGGVACCLVGPAVTSHITIWANYDMKTYSSTIKNISLHLVSHN